MAHLILDYSKRCDEREADALTPSNGIYDSNCGYWKDIQSGNVLVGTSALDQVNSKKWDRETGEDQKGE